MDAGFERCSENRKAALRDILHGYRPVSGLAVAFRRLTCLPTCVNKLIACSGCSGVAWLLTVAGAVPALIREYRTGFPFNFFLWGRNTWNVKIF